LETVGDNEVADLAQSVAMQDRQISADGVYDAKVCHSLLKKKGSRAIIPPRKNAPLWEECDSRNALKAGELKQ